ncbi:MAG TPA: GAF domain-containing protein [Anaerolineales bacterium]|nr:GAF domain-containing protein [Anaerolineales bacterium]
MSRTQILGVITGIGLMAGGLLTIFTAIPFILQPQPLTKLFPLLMDFAGLALLWVARRINQKGNTTLAAHIAIFVMIVFINAHIPLAELERQVILYALPTLLASFLIGPIYSFPYAALSTICYTILTLDAILASEPARYNFISIAELFVLAAVAYILTSRLERALEESRSNAANYQRQAITLENMFDSVILTNAEGKITDWNPAAEHMFGYTKEDVLGESATIIYHPDDIPYIIDHIKTEIEANRRWSGEIHYLRKDGQRGFCATVIVPVYDQSGRLTSTIGVNRDITKHKRAEDALRASESLNRAIIEHAPVGISVRGPTGQLLSYNETWRTIWAMPDQAIQDDLTRVRPALAFDHQDKYLNEYLPDIKRVYQEGGSLYISELHNQNHRPGAAEWVSQYFYAIQDDQGKVSQVVILTEDITFAKQRERELKAIADISQSLRAAQVRSDMLPIILNEVNRSLNCKSSLIALGNEAGGEIIIELAVGSWSGVNHLHLSADQNVFKDIIGPKQQYTTDDVRTDPRITFSDLLDGDYSAAAVPLAVKQSAIGALAIGRSTVFSTEDIKILKAIAQTGANALHRAQLYEQTQSQARQLETVNEIGRSLAETLHPPQIYERISRGLHALLPDLSAIIVSQYDPHEQIITCAYGEYDDQPIDVSTLPAVPFNPDGQGPQSQVIREQKTILVNDLEARLQSSSHNISIGPPPYPQSAIYAPMMVKGQVAGILQVQSYYLNYFRQSDADALALVANSAAIMIENAHLFSETQRRIERLTALRTIDMAINASLDLRVTLNILLEQIVYQLHMDAAAILMFNSHTQFLEFAAGYAFRGSQDSHSGIRIGEGLAGRAALERQTLSIADLKSDTNFQTPKNWLTTEGFTACWASPLIAKGEIKGVLEVFCRSSFQPDQDWLEFLETLAGQAAIAVDNATLFNDLQRSNTELRLAYDTTLEGWSRALDLRDHDTEGHTQRVTELSVRLAEAMGLDDARLLQIRRGALLHDIGKLAVPDRILHKPGPLTPAERDIMSRHPVHAYEMLSPIEFLAPAINIPYCHHEKWDGSGYPRGLKENQIPLEARIFALADVWDSIRSDRPYRKAWPVKKAIEYIRQEAGKYFDPEIVDIFIRAEVWE